MFILLKILKPVTFLFLRNQSVTLFHSCVFRPGTNNFQTNRLFTMIFELPGIVSNNSINLDPEQIKIGPGINKNLLIFQVSGIWGQSKDTYRSRGITRVPSGEMSRRQSASEGRSSGPCRTETLAMFCVGFGPFHNMSVKKMFFNSWWFPLKFLQNFTSHIHQYFHWFLGIFSTHYRWWLQRDTWFHRQHL